MLKCILYLTLSVPDIPALGSQPMLSSPWTPTSLPSLSVCSYPVGCVLDLSDHSLRVSFEWTGDHDEAHKLEAALQCLPLDLPGLLTDVGHLTICPSNSLFTFLRVKP